MTYNTINAHQFPITVNTGTSETPVWTAIQGLNTVTLSPSTTTADAGDFESAGWTKNVVVERGASVSLAGLAHYDAAGVKDPGQAAVESYAATTGMDSIATFRITVPGSKAYEFSASVTDVTPFGGGNTDLAVWEATLEVWDAPTIVSTTPEAPEVPEAPEGDDD